MDSLTARIWWIFTGWVVLWGAIHAARGTGFGWHYFVSGTHLLFSEQGLHLFATHKELQIGPLTFVLIAPIVLGFSGHVAEFLAMGLMSGLGVVLLTQLRALMVPRSPAADRRFLLVGLLVLIVWSELAVTFAHPDDAFALLFATVAVRAARRGHGALSVLFLALGADCKPWALAFIPLLLVARRPQWIPLAALWAALVAAAWLPFVLTDPATLAAGGYRIANSASSSLRVFGVDSAGTPPWDRPAQLLAGVLLGGVAVRRGRWPAVILVAVAARLVLDPATKGYYDAGLIVGTAVCDLLLLSVAVPWFSLSAIALFYLPSILLQSQPHLAGVARTTYLLLLVPAAIFLPERPHPDQSVQYRPMLA